MPPPPSLPALWQWEAVSPCIWAPIFGNLRAVGGSVRPRGTAGSTGGGGLRVYGELLPPENKDTARRFRPTPASLRFAKRTTHDGSIRSAWIEETEEVRF